MFFSTNDDDTRSFVRKIGKCRRRYHRHHYCRILCKRILVFSRNVRTLVKFNARVRRVVRRTFKMRNVGNKISQFLQPNYCTVQSIIQLSRNPTYDSIIEKLDYPVKNSSIAILITDKTLVINKSD